MPRRSSGTLAVMLLAACSGGTSGPNPPPPPPPSGAVGSVTVTPDAVTPFPGDTVRLAASAKTASGTGVPGVGIAWSSSAPAIATVSQSGLVTANTAGTATVTASAGGKSGIAQVTVRPPVSLDAGKLVSKPVGPGGDSLTTTGSNGVTYTLVIPEGALRSGVTVSVTPLLALHQLPFSAGLLAGVALEPSGTTFARPLILRIASAAGAPAGTTLVGFTTPDAGGAVALLPASSQSGIVSIVVPHFSIVGAAPALPSELAAIAPPVDVQSRVNDLADVALAIAQGPDLTTALTRLEAIFGRWYARILPMLNGGAAGDAELLAGLEEYRFWLDTMDWAGRQLGTSGSLLLLPGLTALHHQGRQILYLDLVAAIDRANQACRNNRDLPKAEDALFWQASAESLGFASLVTLSTGIAELSRPVVLAQLCVKVFVSDSTLPAAPPANQSSDLHLRFGIQFGTDPLLRSSTFAVRLTLSGTTADGPVDAITDPSGKLDFSVVPSGQRPLRITVGACMRPVDVGAADVCVVFTLERVFGITVTGNVTVLTAQGLAGLSNVARIVGNLTVVGGPMTGLEDLANLQEVTGSLVLGNLPELTDLTGLRNLRTLTNLTITGLPKLPAIDGMDNLRAVPGTLSLSSLPLVRNLQGFAPLLQIGTLDLHDLPQLSRLGPFQAVTALSGPLKLQRLPLLTDLGGLDNVTSMPSLALVDLPALTTLAPLSHAVIQTGVTIQGTAITTLAQIPKTAAALPGGVFIEDNPRLADLAALTEVTSAFHVLIENNPALVTLGDLAALHDVTSSVAVGGSGLVSLGGLAGLRTTGTLTINLFNLPQVGSVVLPNLVSVATSLLISTSSGNPSITCTTGPTSVSMPELRSVGFLHFEGTQPGSPTCIFDLSLPRLGAVAGLGFSSNIHIFGDGARDVLLGNISIPGGGVFSAGLSGTLRKLTTGTINMAGVLLVSGTTSLTTLASGGGTIGANLIMLQNAPISLQAQQAWANGFTVKGQKQIE